MFDFVMDFIVDPVLELALCRFDFGIWVKHRITGLLLQIPVVISILLLVACIRSGGWFLAIIGLIGLLFFGYLDVKYTIWWIREGRFGSKSSFVDDVPFLDLSVPEGDILSNLSEEEQLRGKLKDSHDQLSSRM